MTSSTARKTFELNNDVRVRWRAETPDTKLNPLQLVDATDALFGYSREEEKALEEQAPWSSE